MKYSELRVLWKPGRPDEKSKQVIVIPLEPRGRARTLEKNFFGDYTAYSGGAVYTDVQNNTTRQNTIRVMVDFNTLVTRDHMDPQAVHAAFCEIQEYRDQLPPDAPMPEKWIETFRREVVR